MKQTVWNDGWKFSKENIEIEGQRFVLRQGTWEDVSLPHTWNAKDGQDGGEDYYRGTCCYVKRLSLKDCGILCGGNPAQEIYLEFEGANSSADCYVNGIRAAHHDGGYSTWRVNLTQYLEEENEIAVAVNNAPSQTVYPQMADFTFYGGLYRSVNLLTVEKKHFDLDYYGSRGVRVTPRVEAEDAWVQVETWLTGFDGTESLAYTIWDGDRPAAQCVTQELRKNDCTRQPAENAGQETKRAGRETDSVCLHIPKVHLWNGRKDPHLYMLEVKLMEDGRVLDERKIRFGCRTFSADPQKGFLLNGKPYPLRGVARHQDWKDIGNALDRAHHERDMELIYGMGANTVRLAHYQHDQYFYDLCDEKGLVVWAEIPYISAHMPGGRENTISQMKELIVQNFHHPGIVAWGLSNEITVRSADDADLLDNHHVLNDLVHEMDPSRLTTMAVIGSCSIDDDYVHIPDTVSYNLYRGWYEGKIEDNGEFLDSFHEKYPSQPLGLSEYGCEAPLNWHSSKPRQGDYTEEYQAYYHEEMIKQIDARPWLWATHVWNMFDFAADARDEGGISGQNCKGLVNFDRSYCKDSYYAYKAWLSDEPFVHICGKRYIDRAEDVTRVTIYSNQSWVELYANGRLLERQTEGKYFYYFNVPLDGEVFLQAKAGECSDESRIRKVETFNETYRMKESGDVLNWYEIEEPEGYFSLNDKISEIMGTEEGKRCLGSLLKGLFGKMQNAQTENTQSADAQTADVQAVGMEKVMLVIAGMSVKRLLSVMGGRNPQARIGREGMLKLNKKLNQIPKVKKEV